MMLRSAAVFLRVVPAVASASVLLLGLSGCTTPLFRAQSPEIDTVEALADAGELDSSVRLVGDVASPYGWKWMPVEGVALVTQLSGTGSDPPPSPMRDQLIKEMQTHDVRRYSDALGSNDTSLVVVRGFIPPGAKKGDTFDIEVRTPTRSKTESLQGGFVMQSRLRGHLLLGGSVRQSDVSALAKGPVIVDALFDRSDEDVGLTRGRVLGGGVVQKSRTLGLFISDEHASVKTSAAMGAAINLRFYHFDHGAKQGVANPTRDNVIELAVHPRYKNNLGRYLRVVQNIAITESTGERASRMAMLESMLLEPTAAEKAALQLEAIGDAALPSLRRAVTARDPEVRFYAAEALAYLDDADAVEALYAAARDHRAFRWRALTALATMSSFQAQESLVKLVHVASAETRYGAFRALRERNPRDPLVRGEILGKKFGYHVLSSSGEPMIHFSRSRRPEVVVMGRDQRLEAPDFLFAGKEIMIKRIDDQTLSVTRFTPGQEDMQKVCSTKLDDVVHAVADLGGGYGDLFRALEDAKQRGYLTARLEVDALPRPGRRFERAEQPAAETEEASRFRVANPIPEMFFDRLNSEPRDAEDESVETAGQTAKPHRTKPGFFGRITSMWAE